MKKILIAICLFISLTACSKKESNENQFTVGMECNYAPFNWTSLDESETSIKISNVDYCDGYDVMIARKIAESLNKELVIKKVAWEGLEPALSSHEIDAIIAGMTDTKERRENVNFTTPYYESEMVVIVRKDSELANIKSIDDLSGKNVLGQINTLYDTIIDQIPNVNHMTPLANYPLMIVSLQNNEADALTAELPVAKGVVSANPDLTYVVFEEKGFDVDTSVSIAIAKDREDLLNSVQKALDLISQEDRENMMLEATTNQPSINE